MQAACQWVLSNAALSRDKLVAHFIILLVAINFALDPEAIASVERRPADISRGCQISVYLAHVHLQWSLARTAVAFARRRSTISYACRQVEDMRDDRAFDAKLTLMEGVVSQLPDASGETSLA